MGTAGTGGTWHKHIILLKTWQESFQTWQNSNCVCKNQRNFEEEQVLSSFPLTPSLTVRCTGAWSGYAFNQLIWYHTITLLPLWFRTKLLMLTTIYRRSSSWDINYTTTSLVFFQSQSSEKSACCIYVEWFLVICKETNTTKLSAQGGNLYYHIHEAKWKYLSLCSFTLTCIMKIWVSWDLSASLCCFLEVFSLIKCVIE